MIRTLVVLAALAGAGAARAQAPDRYGPTSMAPAGPMIVASAAPPLRQLSWPGKSPAPTASPVAVARPSPAPTRIASAPAPRPAAAEAPVPRMSLAAPQPPAYARAYVGEPRAAAALPTPYAPAYPSAGAGAPTAPGVAGHVSTARLYSVHREYGLQPDPAPVPPQFFGPTADLSTPETPDPALLNRRNSAATRAATTAAAEGVSP